MMNLLRIIRHLVVGLAAAAAILIPLWFVITAFGGKFGAWTPLESFIHVRNFAGLLLPTALVLGALALLVSIGFRLGFGRANAPGVGGYVAAVAALAVGGGGILYAQSVRELAGEVPPIHDISTDTANPPAFSAAMVERREIGGATNSVDYASKTDPRSQRPLPEVQAEAYPQVQPILVDAQPDLAYRAALGAAREMGWRVTTASDEALMFEGTAETFWFGFKDDVVVRVTETEGGGSRIDARSVSRVGVSDLGANAARLEAFSQRIRDSLGQG
jgi:uncharacterized protein (DUF1499 family)